MRTSRIAGGRYTSAAVLISLCLGTLLPAANVTKLDTTSIAATTANWSAAPATTDVGEFAGTPSSSTMANLTLGGADLTIGGLQFDGTMTGAATVALAGFGALGLTAFAYRKLRKPRLA